MRKATSVEDLTAGRDLADQDPTLAARRVGDPVHDVASLAHPPRAERSEDFVGTEARTGKEAHAARTLLQFLRNERKKLLLDVAHFDGLAGEVIVEEQHFVGVADLGVVPGADRLQPHPIALALDVRSGGRGEVGPLAVEFGAVLRVVSLYDSPGPLEATQKGLPRGVGEGRETRLREDREATAGGQRVGLDVAFRIGIDRSRAEPRVQVIRRNTTQHEAEPEAIGQLVFLGTDDGYGPVVELLEPHARCRISTGV